MYIKPCVKARRYSEGFTLIEAMIVVVVISILAAVAYPSYQDSVRKANRGVGKAALLELAGKEEQYFLNNKAYTSSVTDLSVGGANLNQQGAFGASAAGSIYSVGITTDATNTSFTLTLTPTNNQVKDTQCGILTLTNLGVKTKSGTGTLQDCW